MSSYYNSAIQKLENAQSNMNFFRSATPQERASLNNSTLSDLSSNSSANGLVRSLDTGELQRLDYARDTALSLAQRKQCVQHCMKKALQIYPREYAAYVCINKCNDARSDYI